MGDHFQYLASMGPLALISAAVFTLAGKAGSDGKYIRIFPCSLILAEDGNPDQAYCDLGNAFYRIGEVDKAAIQFQKALNINPDDEAARANLNLIREEK